MDTDKTSSCTTHIEHGGSISPQEGVLAVAARKVVVPVEVGDVVAVAVEIHDGVADLLWWNDRFFLNPLCLKLGNALAVIFRVALRLLKNIGETAE